MGQSPSAMVVNKGFLTWRLTFSWVIIYSGCFLALNSNSVVAQSSKEPKDEEHTDNDAKEQSSSGMLRSQENSLEDCAHACAEEKRINCKFFKYKQESKTCLMSANDHQNMRSLTSDIQVVYGPTTTSAARASGGTTHQHLKKRSFLCAERETGGKDAGTGRKDTSKWAAEVNSRLNELEQQDNQLEELKSAIGEIREELRMMKRKTMAESHRSKDSTEAQQQAYSKLNHNLAGIRIQEEKVKTAVHALGSMQRVLAKEVGGLKSDQQSVQERVIELERVSGDINSLLASLKATDTALQRELDSVKEGANNLAAAFAKHRQKINEALAQQKMSPAMIKMKHNQGTLATALESVMDKVSSLMGRMPYLEDELRGTNKNVASQALYEHELRAKLITFYKNLIEIKRAVHTLLDPRSAINMERSKRLLTLSSDVSMLSQRDKDTRAEVMEQREDMARLVKDVTHIQLMAQNLGDQLTKVLTASRQFQQDIGDIKKKMKEPKSVVKMAEMQKQVMTALNRLKTREAILLKQLNLYRTSVKKLTDQVHRSALTKSATQDAVHELQSRLGRFEKQIQLLFDKTTDLTRKLTKKPQGLSRDMEKLAQSQALTNDKVVDLAHALQTIRKRVSLLTLELKQTRKEEEEEKVEMAKDVRERHDEMKEREHNLKEQTRNEKEEEARAMKFKALQLEEEKQLQERKMEKELQLEHRKSQMEKEEKRKLVEAERRKRKKLEKEAYKKQLEIKKKLLEAKVGVRKKQQHKMTVKAGRVRKQKIHPGTMKVDTTQIQKVTGVGGGNKKRVKMKETTQKIHKTPPMKKQIIRKQPMKKQRLKVKRGKKKRRKGSPRAKAHNKAKPVIKLKRSHKRHQG